MKFSNTASLLAALASAPISLAAQVDAQNLDGKYSCVGTFIFGRHNDRVVKPANYLTTWGASRQVASGNFYRERYFGLDADGNKVDSDFVIDGLNDEGYYVYGETYAQTAAETVLEYSQMSFLQGFYPPSTAVDTEDDLITTQDSELANGTSWVGPFDGYQYVFMDWKVESSEEFYNIKGDASCPSSDAAIAAWLKTDSFKKMNESTYEFYQSLSDVLPEGAFNKSKLSFKNAVTINDYFYVNNIHNETLANKWNSSLLYKLAYLGDAYQWGISYDSENKLNNFTIGGQSMLGAVLNYLNTTKEEGSPYVNYFTGSYNTMYQMFALMELNKVSDNFTGMPDYGATLVWDLLKDDSSNYFVQFSFKNGTDDTDELNAYPLFGQNETLLSWSDFTSNMKDVSITSLKSWCSACNANVTQCAQFSNAYTDGTKLSDKGIDLSELVDGDYSSLGIKHSSLTKAGAGGIGAGVTIFVFLVGIAAYIIYRRSTKSSKNAAPVLPLSKTATESVEENSQHSTL